MKFFGYIFFSILIQIYSVAGAGGGLTQSVPGAGTGSDTDTTKTLIVGNKLTLDCKLGEPDDDLQLLWFKSGVQVTPTDRLSMVNKTLIITDAQMEDIGNYTCRSKQPSQSFDISVVYMLYKRMSKSATVFQGDKLSLTCDVEGEPTPNIQWYKDDVKIQESVNISRYSMKPNDKGVPDGILLIEAAEYTDRGLFRCSISSQSVHLDTTTYVRVKDMYAALWPFLGICAEVIILCIIIFIYERNRMKNEVDESDTDQPNDSKNSGNNKDSLRQRK